MLEIDFALAVRWIAERFSVPNIKVGRPAGKALASSVPYRVGVHGSEWEVIVRSGLWGAMTAADRSILVVLDYFKDSETGLTRLSYRAIMRYSGVGKTGNVSGAIKELARMHALQVLPGSRVGVTRECSTYRVTLTDPKFLEICNETYASARKEIAEEREYRASQKAKRQRDARNLTDHPCKFLLKTRIQPEGSAPLDPPRYLFPIPIQKRKPERQEAPTCEGLNLSSPWGSACE